MAHSGDDDVIEDRKIQGLAHVDEGTGQALVRLAGRDCRKGGCGRAPKAAARTISALEKTTFGSTTVPDCPPIDTRRSATAELARLSARAQTPLQTGRSAWGGTGSQCLPRG